MPPKGTKSPRTKSPKTPKTGVAPTWESSVLTTSVNQDNWATFVCFLIPDYSVNQLYIDLIEKAMQHAVRRRFDFISKRDLLDAIKTLGKSSKNTTKSVSTSPTLASLTASPFFAAYEHAKSILDTGGEIDDQLWAKLIKCRILDLKKDVQNRTINKTSTTSATAPAAKSDKPKSPGGKKSPKPAAGAKKAAPPTQQSSVDTHFEKSTAVKTRDQIIDQTKYIDDEPSDGPNQYVYLSGFNSVGILKSLDEIGVRIDTINNVSCDNLNETKHLFDEMIQRERQEQTLKADVLKDIPTAEQIAQQNEQNDVVLKTFWSNLMNALDDAPDGSMLQDIIVTPVKVLEEDVPDTWVNTDQRIKLAQSLHNNIIENTYHLNVRKRQYSSFNQQMKVVTIPTIEKPADSSSDSKIYNEMTTIIPPESVSVPLILHSILEQVESQNEKQNNNTTSSQDDVGRYLREKLMKLSMGKDQQKEVENLFPKSPFSKATGNGPTMIYWGDEIKQRFSNLNRLALFDPMKVEYDLIMSHSTLTNLPQILKKTDDFGSKERQTRLNQFLQFCTDEELLLSDVDHALKQFVFECMSINAIPEGGQIENTDRPISPANNREDEQLRLERRLSTLNEEEDRQSTNACPIIWDDPFQLLVTNERTGRIGISTDTLSTSRTSKGSILRSQTYSSKRAVFTVRFDVNNPDNNLYQQMSHMVPPVGGENVDGTIYNINQYHKRNLNDWNFAEHFEPDVFVQVIEQALFTHSHIDVYQNRRDQTQMLILSLPVPEGKTVGHENESKKLFSDVGFRNFLDEVVNEIDDWLKEEEAKYEADVLAKEVTKYVRETSPLPDTAKAAATALETNAKKGKGATGKKTPPVRSASPSPDSGHSTDEERTIRDNYVHPTSLKAWKQKKDKETQDLEQQQQQQQAKTKRPASGNRSPKAKSPRAGEKAADKAAKPPTPRDKSPKSGEKKKRPTSATPSEKPQETKPSQDLNQSSDRFIGYGLGNRLLSAQINTSNLLLPDGCLVRTRKDKVKRGSTCVSTSLYRNKSSYRIQLINPKGSANSEPETMANQQNNMNDSDPKDTTPGDKRVAQYGVFTAMLNSGLIISSSNYDTSPPKFEAPPEPPAPEVPVEEKVEDKKKDAAANKNKKKGKAAEVEAPPVATAQIVEEKLPPPPPIEVQPFQRLTISIPTGLVITYYPESYLGVKPTESNQPHRLVVKQYYPHPSKGFHTCEQSRLNAYEEISRIFDADGNVIIFKRNTEIIIFQADGGIFSKTIVHQSEPETETLSEASHSAKKDNKSETKVKRKADSKPDTDASTVNEEARPLTYQWKSITADGQVYVQNIMSQEYEKVDQLRLILETNPKTNEQVIHREDKVVIVFRADGPRIVSFPDGTRITTYDVVDQKVSSPNDRETGERVSSMLGFRKIRHVKVESFGYATVAFNCQTTDTRTIFNDGTSIDVFTNGTYSIFESDGEKLDINDNGDILFDFQQSIYGKRVQEILSNIEPSKCIMSQNGDIIFDAVDYEQTQYCVESTGETYFKDSGQYRQSAKLAPLEMHVPRYFIVHEDGSGTELLRFKDLYSYLRTMDLDPSTAVVREPLLSNPKVTGATIMRPFQDDNNRRWLSTFDEESVIPQSLRNYTSATAMTRTDSTLSESHQSLAHHLNPHDATLGDQSARNNQQKYKSNTLTTGLSIQQAVLEMPKALEYRNFMEFPRLQDDIRMKLFTSLKSYIEFIKDRADFHTKLLPHDYRSRYEKEKANKIWKTVRPKGATKDDLTLLYLKTLHPDRQKAVKQQSVVELAKKFNLTHVYEELHQEKINRQLKVEIDKGVAVPYFKSEWGMAYIKQQQQQQEYTQRTGSKNTATIKTTNGNENVIKSPPNSPIEQQQYRLPQTLKILPTRSASTEVEDNKTVGDAGQQDYDNYQPVSQFKSPRTHLQYDVVGKKRICSIKAPSGLKGFRPNAEPNIRFLDMEEPVMVRPNNASIGTAALNNRPLRERRGCELFPDRIDFGILKEGVTYGAEFEIKNVGIDACRFRIRQPPLGTGLRIVFQPGLIAAGMRRSITVELYAIIKQNQSQQNKSQGLYQLEQSIEIITETDIMRFPLRAKIASEEQFDAMFANKDETAGMHRSVRLLARKSSNTIDWLTNTNESSMNATND